MNIQNLNLKKYFCFSRTAAPPTRERKNAAPPKERGEAAPTRYIIYINFMSCQKKGEPRHQSKEVKEDDNTSDRPSSTDPKAGEEDNRHQAARRDVRRNTPKKEAAKSSTPPPNRREKEATPPKAALKLYCTFPHCTLLYFLSLQKKDGREGGTTPKEDGTAAPTKAAPLQRREREHHSKGRGGRQHHTKEPW